MTTEPKSRLSLCFEWGLNCKTLGHSEEQGTRTLDMFGITDREERDHFWMGYLEEPRKDGSVVNVDIGPSRKVG
ncbi:hypothetical protein EVB87_022 [Rhizobium phage RHph_N28_1]|nr:hypothetical protein EVB87_022 [Rhizobium phage RHph_N28_1]QIG74050.1 hypothetical protein EVC07_022 [Rhizobium phage RHph_N42]